MQVYVRSAFVFILLAFPVSTLAETPLQRAHAETIALTGFPDLRMYRLTNGLTVILWPDANARLTTVHTWVRAGALYESPTKTGVAHLLEHLVLGRSKFAPQGAIEFESRYGALVGATTKYKTIDFYLTTPPEHLEEMLRYQGDILKNLSLDERAIEHEKHVIRNELASLENSSMLALMLLAKALYSTHQAKNFATGDINHLASLSVRDCLEFYQRQYSASNTTLIITGRFQEETVLAWVETYFQSLRKGHLTPLPKGPTSIAEASRLTTYKTKTRVYPFLASYLFPFEVGKEEESALNFALYILFSGDHSLAGSLLVGKHKLAQFVELDSQTVGFHAIKANLTGDHGKLASTLIDEAAASLAHLSPAQYETYATAYRADTLRRLQTTTQRALLLGWHATHRSGLTSLANDLNPQERIPLESVKRVAAKYLVPGNKVIQWGAP